MTAHNFDTIEIIKTKTKGFFKIVYILTKDIFYSKDTLHRVFKEAIEHNELDNVKKVIEKSLYITVLHVEETNDRRGN